MDFNEELRARTKHVNAVIRDYLPEEEGFQKTLLEAMNYSMLAGGKRLRPLMMECAFEMFGGKGRIIGPFMAAIEMMHTHSLIHDDLPAMDDDEYRRGMKTTHIMYGEAMAILAGDGLLNTAYQTAAGAFECERIAGSGTPEKKELSKQEAQVYERIARALVVFSEKSGIYGMIGGQSCDVEYDGRTLTGGQVDFIDSLKTAALIEASLMIGAILAGAPDGDVRKLEKIGRDIGVAFQIRDDILDITGTMEELGKPAGSDERNEKTTFVSLYGLEEAGREVERRSENALTLFDTLEGKHAFLRALLEHLINRRK